LTAQAVAAAQAGPYHADSAWHADNPRYAERDRRHAGASPKTEGIRRCGVAGVALGIVLR